MGKATKKSMKKFASSGQLKKTIEARKKHQQIKKKFQNRRGNKGPKEQQPAAESESDEDEDQVEEDFDDNASFGSVDDLDELDEGQDHLMELSKLAEKDPEFYKYLQENDRQLLDFDPNAMQSGDEAGESDAEDDVDMEEERLPPLTTIILRQWQKALLEQRSLRALRKLLIAFRSAAHMNEEGQVLAWSIDSSSVYNKLLSTTFRYTPVILGYHVPYKTLPNGKFKAPTQTQKFKTLQKLILAYFHNVIHILDQLTDNEIIQLAVTESAKILPYVISSRKTIKLYLKKCLELWSTAEDSTRIAAFLAIRKLASATDQSILDNVLKGTYMTLVRSSKSTSVYTLPSINLMKNSASEVFCLDQATSYQHAFGYIRQLAIHLRNSMKVKTKEAYRQVYNWQFIHSLDFWSIVLARACDAESEAKSGVSSELKALIYPLVQVSLGSIKLVSNSRSYPFHLHVIRSLLHLTRHTQIYIPISPYLLPVLTSTLSSSSRLKSSTLRPLDLEVHIRTPQQYLKTRVYIDGLIEEASYLLSEWLAVKAVHGSIGFPGITVPIIVVLRKAMKGAKSGSSSGKDVAQIKTLAERIEDSSKWVAQKRKSLRLAPGRIAEVEEWERELKQKLDEAPLTKYLKVQRKAREKRRKMMENARQGQDEVIED
ncbi:nucleolar complex protein 2 [Moniliophthora roreri MCA 2997]|uniref:Nucleolar complex protein 2 n=1 Tax=Moniliophthora roreri (strain MCA 2997) TaxID=1381753 RepID=V2XBN7_MONRO|nr:nucleolar complex protein 2 [Moniliophthora roreri MCA 2997]